MCLGCGMIRGKWHVDYYILHMCVLLSVVHTRQILEVRAAVATGA